MMNLLQSMRRYLSIIALVTCSIALLSSCKSVTSSDTVDYKSAGAVRGPNLSYPPDLITAQADRRYIVQDGTATMSEYNAAVKKSAQLRSNVMTGIPGMRIARDGERRWLVVEKPAPELYPQVKDFWQENGFLLVVDSPSTGIMETDWAENRAKIAQVIYNRLAEKMKLEIDASVKYGQDPTMSWTDMKATNTPYNTYINPGLPPTPIANPGRASLQAALAPAGAPAKSDEACAGLPAGEKCRYLYYVLADRTGRHVFATTYEQHLANIEIPRAAGVLP